MRYVQSHPTTLEFTDAAEASKAFGTMFSKRVRSISSNLHDHLPSAAEGIRPPLSTMPVKVLHSR